MKVVKKIALTLAILGVANIYPIIVKAGNYYDLFYPGPYEVLLEDETDTTLNCRYKPGTEHDVKLRLRIGERIEAKSVDYRQDKPWFYTNRNCYIRASSAYLKWRGLGEDPSTMCDPRYESC